MMLEEKIDKGKGCVFLSDYIWGTEFFVTRKRLTELSCCFWRPPPRQMIFVRTYYMSENAKKELFLSFFPTKKGKSSPFVFLQNPDRWELFSGFDTKQGP